MDELIDLIEQLASSDNIKICCSSRPWPSFADAFGQKENLMLKLEELTAGDMRKFVTASPQRHKRFPKYARDSRFPVLIEEIARRAEGFFLWVSLVVKSLRDGLTNADRIADLERRLKSMPSDLEALFWRMIKSIDPFYKRKSSELLLIVGLAPTVPAVFVDLLDELDDDPQILANGLSCEVLGEPPEWLDNLTRKLDARTKGLVELRDFRTPVDVEPSQVEHHKVTLDVLHRSVLEFLSTPTVVQELERDCRQGFDPLDQVVAASLIFLLSPTIPATIPSNVYGPLDDDFKLYSMLSYCVAFEKKHGMAPMRYLRLASQRHPVCGMNFGAGRQQQSFLSMAVLWGSTGYLLEALREDPDAVKDEEQQSSNSVLFMTLFAHHQPIRSSTVEAILRHGANLRRPEGATGLTAWSVLLRALDRANPVEWKDTLHRIARILFDFPKFDSYNKMKEIFASFILHGADMSNERAEPVIRQLLKSQDAEELLRLTPTLEQIDGNLDEEGSCTEGHG